MTNYDEYLNSVKDAIADIESDTYETRKMLSKMKESFSELNLSGDSDSSSFDEVYLSDYGVYEDPDELEFIDDISVEDANELYKWYDEALKAVDNLDFYVDKYRQLLTLFEEVEYIFEGVENDG